MFQFFQILEPIFQLQTDVGFMVKKKTMLIKEIDCKKWGKKRGISWRENHEFLINYLIIDVTFSA